MPQAGSTLDQQVFEEKVKRFQQDLLQLQEKHGVAVIATLQITEMGIAPVLKYANKAQLDMMMKSAMNVASKAN